MVRERIVEWTIWFLLTLLVSQTVGGNVADCVSKQRAVGPSARLSNADEKERGLDQENQSEEESKS